MKSDHPHQKNEQQTKYGQFRCLRLKGQRGGLSGVKGKGGDDLCLSSPMGVPRPSLSFSIIISPLPTVRWSLARPAPPRNGKQNDKGGGGHTKHRMLTRTSRRFSPFFALSTQHLSKPRSAMAKRRGPGAHHREETTLFAFASSTIAFDLSRQGNDGSSFQESGSAEKGCGSQSHENNK